MPQNPNDSVKPKAELTPNQIRALELSFGGQSLTEVSQKVGVRRETIQEWKKLPAWVVEWNVRLERMREQSRQRSLAAYSDALTCLARLVNGEGDLVRDRKGKVKTRTDGKTVEEVREPVPYSVRLGAAAKLLDVDPRALDPLPVPKAEGEAPVDMALIRALAAKQGLRLVPIGEAAPADAYSPEDAAPGNAKPEGKA